VPCFHYGRKDLDGSKQIEIETAALHSPTPVRDASISFPNVAKIRLSARGLPGKDRAVRSQQGIAR
jgi:hypothetical protein